uniref:Uncharacterized protein n=1 Tax=Onchocerca volvulus TaxID=6282 RepID=A0A8R1TYC4_ONCVO
MQRYCLPILSSRARDVNASSLNVNSFSIISAISRLYGSPAGPKFSIKRNRKAGVGRKLKITKTY